MIKHHIAPADWDHRRPRAIRDGFGDALLALMKKQWNVVVVCADLRESLRLEALATQYPARFFEVGVAEQNMIGVAAGLAKEGLLPFAASFAAFSPGRTFDQIRVSVAYSDRNVKIVGGHAGLTVGADGATHQMCEDLAMMRALPHLRVLVPGDYSSAVAATMAAAAQDGPVYLRLSRAVTRDLWPVRADVHQAVEIHPGDQVSILATGVMIERAYAVARLLVNEGVTVQVLAFVSIKPLDSEAVLVAAQHTGRVVTMEEHQVAGGFGSAVAEFLSEHYPTPLLRLGVMDAFGDSGSGEEVMTKFGLDVATMANRIRHFVHG